MLSTIGPTISKVQLSKHQMHSLPVYSSMLERVQGDDGWLAVGDAASSYDLIAAQGLYKTLINGVAAGRVIAKRLGDEPQASSKIADNYQRSISVAYQNYAQNREYLYRLEQRWEGSLFWQNRWKTLDMPAAA